VDRRAHLLIGAAAQILVIAPSISASVGFGLSLSRAAAAMIIAALAIAALRHVVIEPRLLYLVQRAVGASPSTVVIGYRRRR